MALAKIVVNNDISLINLNLSLPIFSSFFVASEGHMCNRDLDNLRRWQPDDYLSPQRAEVLTPQGVEDMKLLARRLQSNFPELLLPNANNITSANYKVFFSLKCRNKYLDVKLNYLDIHPSINIS